MTTYQVQIPSSQLPKTEALINKIQKMTKLSPDQMYERYQTRIPNQRGDFGFSDNPIVVEAWAHLIIERGLKIGQITNGLHMVDIPEDDNSNRRPSAYAAFNLFGVSKQEADMWFGTYFGSTLPCYVYRYHRLCARYGVRPISPRQYYEYLSTALENADVDGMVPIKKMTKWIQIAAGLNSVGVDHEQVEGFGWWVMNDWSWEAIHRLSAAGISGPDARDSWNAGIHDSKIICQYLRDGLPLEWALSIYRAQSDASEVTR